MKSSFKDLFILLAPHLSTDLIDDSYQEYILSISKRLPLLSWGCFECRLTAESQRVDFMLSINQNELLEIKNNKNVLSSIPVLDAEIWKSVKEFSNIFYKENSLFAEVVLNLWLEYDIENSQKMSSIPFLFTTFRDLKYNNQINSEIVINTLKQFPNNYSTNLKIQLKNCVMHLPYCSRIYGIGLMNTRYNNVIRLGIIFYSFEELKRYLATIYLITNPQELLKDLLMYVDYCDSFLLHLDIGEEVNPRIGVEFCFDYQKKQKKLRTFIALLENANLCDKAKGKAVLNWDGTDHFQDSSFSSPTQISNEDPLINKVRRWVSYIKFVLEPGNPVHTKAYLFFQYY